MCLSDDFLLPTFASSVARSVDKAGQVTFFIKETTLPINTVYLWSDAMTSLRWLNSSNHHSMVFVASCPRVLNPVGELNRALYPVQLYSYHPWFPGLDFLILPERVWPACALPTDKLDSEDGRRWKLDSEGGFCQWDYCLQQKPAPAYTVYGLRWG